MEKTIFICKGCKKESFKTNRIKLFCSEQCRANANSKKRYHKVLKNDPEYKRKRKIYFRNWLENNRQHFNELMREPNRKRNHERYYYFDKKNLCVNCGKKRDVENRKKCFDCMQKYYGYLSSRRNLKNEN